MSRYIRFHVMRRATVPLGLVLSGLVLGGLAVDAHAAPPVSDAGSRGTPGVVVASSSIANPTRAVEDGAVVGPSLSANADPAGPQQSAGEGGETDAGLRSAIDLVQRNADFMWTLLAAVLVFLMQAGFTLVEAGLTRAKNAVNICMKNLMDFSLGSLAFWLIGFGLMFGPSGGWLGTGGFMLSDFATDQDPWLYAFWIFQTVFAATAATIVSGAMAERTKFSSYILYSVFLTALVYPVFGSWAWGGLYRGGGWLEGLGFIDFAGSTVVHSIGGWSALAGAIVIGPRLGRYGEDGRPRAMPGHNLVLATMGMFLLWFGWFGFNAGSTTAATTDIALIAVNTNLAAAAGAVAAMLTSWWFLKKPDVTMTMNGALAGLVGITAGCANVVPGSSIVIGLVAGALVVFSVLFFDRVRIDDPVGAISVHGVCGAWGTLAAGLFNASGTSMSLVGTQLLGIGAAFLWAFTTMFVFFKLVKATVGLRVSPEEEVSGLDVLEHGNEAYAPDTFSATATGVTA